MPVIFVLWLNQVNAEETHLNVVKYNHDNFSRSGLFCLRHCNNIKTYPKSATISQQIKNNTHENIHRRNITDYYYYY